jgi:hypothetical protein
MIHPGQAIRSARALCRSENETAITPATYRVDTSSLEPRQTRVDDRIHLEPE